MFWFVFFIVFFLFRNNRLVSQEFMMMVSYFIRVLIAEYLDLFYVHVCFCICRRCLKVVNDQAARFVCIAVLRIRIRYAVRTDEHI